MGLGSPVPAGLSCEEEESPSPGTQQWSPDSCLPCSDVEGLLVRRWFALLCVDLDALGLILPWGSYVP